MHYVIEEGTNEVVLVLLHAMGGDATSLFELAAALDPAATLLGIEGQVFEEGERRYFERFIDKSFVPASLEENTRRVYAQIEQVVQEQGWGARKLVVVGEATGANVAQNMLKLYETTWAGMVLFHPSLTRPFVPFREQVGLKLLITYGIADPYTLREEHEWIVAGLRAAGVDVRTLEHSWGHVLKPEEVTAARELVREIADQ